MNDDRRPEILWLDEVRKREEISDIQFVGPVQNRDHAMSQSYEAKSLVNRAPKILCLACALLTGLTIAVALMAGS